MAVRRPTILIGVLFAVVLVGTICDDVVERRARAEIEGNIRAMQVADRVRAAIGTFEGRLALDSPVSVVTQLRAAGRLPEAVAAYVLKHPEQFTIWGEQFDAAWIVAPI